MDNRGRFIKGKLAAYLETEIIEHKLDIVSIDPFVKSHSVDENNNSVIDDVAQILVDLSIKHDIAVDAPHHTSKGIAQPGNADRGRGASSLKDAGRLVYTITPMSVEEAKTYGVNEELRRVLVRMDSGKVNIMPPLHLARWYKLVGVMLGNVTELYPNGDNV